jgi:CARDB protein
MRLQVVAGALVVSLVACGVVFAATAGTRAKPDLVVRSLSNPPTVVFQGSSFPVTDTTRNVGGATALPGATQYYLSTAGHRTAIGRRPVPRLRPQRSSTHSATARVPVTLELGAYSLIACADGTHIVRESNERNNCRVAATKVVVKKPPPPV